MSGNGYNASPTNQSSFYWDSESRSSSSYSTRPSFSSSTRPSSIYSGYQPRAPAYNFIRDAWGTLDNFMACHGLRLGDPADREVARQIIQAMRE